MDLGAFARSVASLDADVLALQEVDRHQERSQGSDQPALAVQAMGALHFRFADVVHGTPGVRGWVPGRDAAHPHDGPAYGVALLSRRPVRQWHLLHLDAGRGLFPIPVGGRPPRVLWLHDEPRAVVAAELEDPRLVVACTHLSFVPLRNARQLRAACAWLGAIARRSGIPAVLLGDLNLPGGLPRRITGWTPLSSASTFPAPSPRVQLDHALASPGFPAVSVHAETRRLPVSDHRAIVLRLGLNS